MTLTAYSTSAEREDDVEQILRRLSKQFDEPFTTVEAVPEHWRAFMRKDLQCPCCHVVGSELVKEAVSTVTKKAVRQACFRFGNPKHREHCDFANSDTAGAIPENLVAFSEANTATTKAVRELVGTGMELGIFSQRTIRDMREWFFNKKIESMFVVTLDPRFPKHIRALYREHFNAKSSVPDGVELTAEIVADPSFRWRAAVAREQLRRHTEFQQFWDAWHKKRNAFHFEYAKMGTLARKSQGRPVFDPTPLESNYRKTVDLAEFIARNYKPLADTTSQKGVTVPSVLALAALLLFARDWNLDEAGEDFIAISKEAGHANQDLGNVMGLNPFHDFRAWQALKGTQEFNIHVATYVDLKAERAAIEQEMRAQFGAPPMQSV